MSGEGSGRSMAVLLTVVVAVAVAFGLNLVGSPAKARLRALDERRVDDLQQITYEVGSWWKDHQALPPVLDSLGTPRGDSTAHRDPATGAIYEYRVTGDSSWEVCATFTYPTEPSRRRYPSDNEWQHPAGRHCFPVRQK
jgi:hypothetical protein